MNQILLLTIVLIVWLAKVAICNYWMFHSLLMSSMWKQPLVFLSFWLPKIAASVCLTILCLIAHYWVILIVLFADLWMEANIVYKRANNRAIDYYALRLTGNMNGFWNSVIIYLRVKDLLLSILSGMICFLCLNYFDATISITFILVGVLFALILQVVANWCHSMVYDMPFVPIQITQKQRFDAYCHNVMPIDKNTVFHSFFWILSDSITNRKANYVLSEDAKKKIETFISPQNSINQDSPLLILLIESLENWVIQPDIMPNLYSFLKTNNVLYCSNVKSQIKQGISADGQLIVNTGLLPIQHGATSYLFSTNIYPSLMKISGDNNLVILPREDNAWNKDTMLTTYGLNKRKIVSLEDKMLFAESCKAIENGVTSVWTLTVATHAPFTYAANQSKLKLSNTMPSLMQNYIKSFNVLDMGFEEVIKHLASSNILQKATIVITGDHTIIPDDDRKEFQRYCKKENLAYGVQEYCPLIIRSPKIAGNQIVADNVYQMDIYPTILSLIGCEDYWWEGFGVNLLDSVAIKNRPITEEDAYDLSDKIIRSNYFKSLFSK